MRLGYIDIAGFRAISRVRIRIRDVTVLVGEHNSGKSTVLDALDACLGIDVRDPVAEIDLDDFCRFEGEVRRISIVLGVEETTRGEWKGTAIDAVATASPNGSALRRVEFRVDAHRAGADGIEKRLSIVDRESGAEAAAAAWRELRARMPVLHLRADRFLVPRMGEGNGVSEEASDALGTFRELCHAGARVSRTQVAHALHAAERVLEELPDRLVREPTEVRRSLEAIDRPRSALSRLAGGISSYRPGTGAQAAGVFLLMSMLVDARGPAALPEDSWPIVLIEEPEAHLHPIVASMAWGLLEGLRAQVVATTYSSEIVASTPLQSLRRLVRRAREITVREINGDTLDPDELRRVSYHVRVKRGGALFARCWVLVEGETEGWLLPELANLCGYSLPAEGVECIEFAQSGIPPLVKAADGLGIAWHLIADGDRAGRSYAAQVRRHLRGRADREHVTALRAFDIEHFLFENGYAWVYREAAGLTGRTAETPERARSVIRRAIKATSKPQMALRVVEAMAKPDGPGVPPLLREMVETVVGLARANAWEG